MKSLIWTCALFLGLGAVAVESTWKDGNGVKWTPLPIKSTFYRTYESCRRLRMRLPSANDLLDAIEYGLFDPEKNPAFAKEISGYDWMWVRDPGILSAQWMVSKQGERRWST